MSFKQVVSKREIHCIDMLLSVFGVVEAEQMRRLFEHLSDAQYGSIMSRMRRDGAYCTSSDALLLSQNSYTLKTTEPAERIPAFEAFITLKDRMCDFCAGDAPAVATIVSKDSDYDLIPVMPYNIGQINDSLEHVPEKTKRLLVVSDLDLVGMLQRRYKNDYVFYVSPDKKVEMYEL